MDTGRLRLILRFVSQSARAGSAVGAILGLLCLLPLALVIFASGNPEVLCTLTSLPIAIGAAIGAIVGGLNGISLGILTVTGYQKHFKPQDYRRAIMTAAAAVTALLGAIVYVVITRRADLFWLIVCVLAPALLAAYASRDVSNWYLDQKRKTSEQSLTESESSDSAPIETASLDGLDLPAGEDHAIM